EIRPVSATITISGSSTVPSNDVNQGPRNGLRQKVGRKGPGGGAESRCPSVLLPRLGSSRDRSGGVTVVTSTELAQVPPARNYAKRNAAVGSGNGLAANSRCRWARHRPGSRPS